jgi:hypothetical protein
MRKFMVAQFVQMIEELKKCEKAGATTACLMQIYVYIDTQAFKYSFINFLPACCLKL